MRTPAKPAPHRSSFSKASTGQPFRTRTDSGSSRDSTEHQAALTEIEDRHAQALAALEQRHGDRLTQLEERLAAAERTTLDLAGQIQEMR